VGFVQRSKVSSFQLLVSLSRAASMIFSYYTRLVTGSTFPFYYLKWMSVSHSFINLLPYIDVDLGFTEKGRT
jgi:membrane-associated protease RseP (regulator of RpoE activity)